MATEDTPKNWADIMSKRDRLPPIAVVEAENLSEWTVSWHETTDRINAITNKQDNVGFRGGGDGRERSVIHLQQEVSVPNGTLIVTFKTSHTKGSPTIEPKVLIDFEPTDDKDDLTCVAISLKWGEYTTYVEAELGVAVLDSAELTQITNHPLDLQIKTISC